MTQGDIIEPIMDSKAISETRMRLQTLRSVHSCSAVPIQDSQSGGNDTQIKHEEQNRPAKEAQSTEKKRGDDLESEAGADISVIRVGEEGGSPKFKIPNTRKISALPIEQPCSCGDGRS